MYSIDPPSVSSTESFTESVSAIRDAASRERFSSELPAVEDRCRTYDRLAKRGRMASVAKESFDLPALSGPDMVSLYDSQFSRSRRTAEIRDVLRNSARNAICPYCGQGMVAELDHYLPKTAYAGTTVHPSNLVPCCRDCNRAKLAYVPSRSAPAVLHPYFDSHLNVRWLHGEVRPGPDDRPVVTFGVNLVGARGRDLRRIETHLAVFDLHRRFGVWAAQALDELQRLIRESPAPVSASSARDLIRMLAELGSGGRANSWERAAYEAMADSDWYIGTHLGLV